MREYTKTVSDLEEKGRIAVNKMMEENPEITDPDWMRILLTTIVCLYRNHGLSHEEFEQDMLKAIQGIKLAFNRIEKGEPNESN